MIDEHAPLDRTFVERMLEVVRSGQTKAGFGVTLEQDHSGAWGQMGKTYITVRFDNPNLPDDMIQVTMEVTQVTSSAEDDWHHKRAREDK